jgi:hypothetical protein
MLFPYGTQWLHEPTQVPLIFKNERAQLSTSRVTPITRPPGSCARTAGTALSHQSATQTTTRKYSASRWSRSIRNRISSHWGDQHIGGGFSRVQQLPSIVDNIPERLVEPLRPLPIPITIFPGVRRTGLVLCRLSRFSKVGVGERLNGKRLLDDIPRSGGPLRSPKRRVISMREKQSFSQVRADLMS